jgi:ribosomal protein L13E
VRHGRRHALPEAERVAAHEVGARRVGVVEGVEEERRGRAEQVLDVLRQRVDVLARGVLGHLHEPMAAE